MSPILRHISSVLNISVRKAISRPERCEVLSQRWQKNNNKMTHDLSSALCGQSNEKQRLSFSSSPHSPPAPTSPCPCCLLPTATWAWILSPVSRLEIVDSDLVVKLEPGPVDGIALKEQVYFKPKERLHVRREPAFSLSQTSSSPSVLIVCRPPPPCAHFQFLL